MAYHKIEIPDDTYEVPKAMNLGVAYGEDKLFIFGGYDGRNYLDSFLIFDLKANAWEKFSELSLSSRPSARHLHVIKYVEKHLIVIFGGAHTNNFYNDTYVFNTRTYNWECVSDSRKVPWPRYGMCGDMNESHLYIIAGYGTNPESGEDRYLDDLWSFDVKARQWNQINTVGEDRPKGTGWNCVIYNKVIYCLGSSVLKFYLLSLQTREWQVISTLGTIPDKLELYGFSRCDSGSFYVYGGISYSEESDSTYSLDLIDDQYIWHKLECTGNKPGIRVSFASVSLGDSIIYIGGKTGSVLSGDIYAFNPNIGLRWICLKVVGNCPSERVGHTACYIEALGGIVIHGGDSRGVVNNDLYLFKYKEKAWEKIDYQGESPALSYHSCAYDKEKNIVIYYGGGNLQECSGEIYVLNINSMTWSIPKSKKRIPARAGHYAFIHPTTHEMVVIGGFISIEGYTNEVWSFSIDDAKWTKIATSTNDGPMPVGRIAMACMLYEFYNECWLYMHGGVNSEIVLDDLWRLNLLTWEWQRLPQFSRSPGSVYGHTALLIENSIFEYVGNSVDSRGNAIKVPSTGILWSLNLTHNNLNWCRYKVEGSIPPKRFYTAVLVTNDIVIYGGGPDPNIYQLDRNDVPPDAVSTNIFSDFILPYKSIPMFSGDLNESSIEMVEDKITNINKKGKPKSKKGYKKSSSKGSTEQSFVTTIPEDEEEEEKIQIFGEQSSRETSRRSSITSDRSYVSLRAEELIQKAKESALVRRRKK
ncbi:unnamed protein product [Blepharisma stoltei]|uniref:Galactose oxidase n=1 Tax=Blepharisma stoltei TaxID=1481888 RepID=A0AAU9JPT3_9CILI|nr:unnamed protein product [Blepharisma stoltei]